jgi:hypothetical protein
MNVKQNTKGKWVEEGLDFDIGIMKLQKNQLLFMTKLLESFINLVQFSNIIHDGLPFAHDVIIHPSTSFVVLNTLGIVYITKT